MSRLIIQSKQRIFLPAVIRLLTSIFTIVMIESHLTSAEKFAVYPQDFVQKGFPRKDRAHKDPPALMKKENGLICYVVAYGVYQLYGREGKLTVCRPRFSMHLSAHRVFLLGRPLPIPICPLGLVRRPRVAPYLWKRVKDATFQ